MSASPRDDSETVAPDVSPTHPRDFYRGGMAWMARNSVAANLLMLVLLVWGIFSASGIKQEVFPEFDLDMLSVGVGYPGASPEEVEQAVVLPIEEALADVDGIKEMRAFAREGAAGVTLELEAGADPERTLAAAKSAIDRIVVFPEEVERPQVALVTRQSRVISLVLFGDVGERELRDLAIAARDELLASPEITNVTIGGVRSLEVSIEVEPEALRSFGLTIDEIAATIRRASVDLPGGGIKTSTGEVLVRTRERRDTGREFGDIVLRSLPDGGRLRVRDIATVRDGFTETEVEARFNGKRAVMLNAFRVGDQTPLGIARAAQDIAAAMVLPPGVTLTTWKNTSKIYEQRLDLLMRNARLGLLLVAICLGLFLELRLAFWVTMGIPISFIGSLVLLPVMDVSVNMISLFAYIVTLGIVVDDAIVVGEAVYMHRERGEARLTAAIAGVRDVGTPVIFSVLTTIIAFLPMLFIPGSSGKFFRVIPLVVICVLLLSLVESLFILPAHLAHSSDSEPRLLAPFAVVQRAVSAQLRRFTEGLYRPFLEWTLRYRYFTLCCGLALLILSVGQIAGGTLRFTFMPKIESDWVSATLNMPFGTPLPRTRELTARIEGAASAILNEPDVRGVRPRVFTELGSLSARRSGGSAGAGSHLGRVRVHLGALEDRQISAREFTNRWRERVGEIAGAESLRFRFATGHGGSAPPLDIGLGHSDIATLRQAAATLADKFREYDGVFDVDDGFSLGKERLDLKLLPEGQSQGLTARELGRQVRSSFFGALAARQQRGRDELRVYVRLPRDRRSSEFDLERMMVMVPGGGEMPLSQAAVAKRGRAFTQIDRVDAIRTVTVSGDVRAGAANVNMIMSSLMESVLPRLKDDFPGLRYGRGGQQSHQARTMGSLRGGFVLAVLAMFALLAVAFGSYTQPIIIMVAIPFGFVGAIMGHLLLGFNLSLISLMGIVALSGIVVNDSLILIVAANVLRRGGASAFEAVSRGARRRLRPILLTSLTTFFGLMPMLLETSVQARFLIPMAISLAFGVLFATVITLVFVPALYLVLEDIRS